MCPLLAQLKIGFFSSFSAVAVYSTNETNKAGLKQSIIFRCLWAPFIMFAVPTGTTISYSLSTGPLPAQIAVNGCDSANIMAPHALPKQK